jgi:heme-degrading monooxygenase HmoA
MIAVLFELEPAPGQQDSYFALAAQLFPELQHVDGFVSIERFESLSVPGKFLSLSFWRDEEAVLAWRNNSPHRAAQKAGRKDILQTYRLRVASVLRDYDKEVRETTPGDSLVIHRKTP